MKLNNTTTSIQDVISAPAASANRRSFLRNAAGASAAIAALGMAPRSLFAASTAVTAAVDTPAEIFTAALVAEDLATTFYYNVLVGEVVQDPNLSGPGGTAANSSNGSPSNVGYIRAALSEEILHANLFRSLLGISSAAKDPYQTFYFKPVVFSDLNSFIGQLEALEGAFIGAYLAAIQQFALLAAEGKALTFGGSTYQPSDFAYFAKISASILGVEAEHRALGRAISPNIIPANQLAYEGTDGITTVYNGSKSAVAALLPFLTPNNQAKGYTLSNALANQKKVSIPVGGTAIPAE
jgi:hypothetical protein